MTYMKHFIASFVLLGSGLGTASVKPAEAHQILPYFLCTQAANNHCLEVAGGDIDVFVQCNVDFIEANCRGLEGDPNP